MSFPISWFVYLTWCFPLLWNQPIGKGSQIGVCFVETSIGKVYVSVWNTDMQWFIPSINLTMVQYCSSWGSSMMTLTALDFERLSRITLPVRWFDLLFPRDAICLTMEKINTNQIRKIKSWEFQKPYTAACVLELYTTACVLEPYTTACVLELLVFAAENYCEIELWRRNESYWTE